ncbi:tripartite tricarboxylate transporter substrate binding protein [Alcaligenaceae bacterium]|nr:tripartite tricarboxylate transporter substrate binding protein [Alcaligenaceae bacterium]
MKKRLNQLSSFVFACVLSGGAVASQAAYPAKALQLVVPFPAGGSVDIVSRAYAQQLSSLMGQSVVVENKAGANGVIGAQYVANAKPDGYTLLMASSGTFTITPALQKTSFDPVKSFTYIGLVTNYTNVLLVNKDSHYQSVGEIIEQAKKKPGEVTFGSSGVGGSNHLGGELLAYRAGVEMLHIPYTGNAPAMTDLIGGRIDFMFDITTTARNHVAGGKVRPLAITSAEPNPVFPSVPTIAEAGFPTAEFNGWFGVMGPRGIPDDIAQKLSAANKKIIESPEFQKQVLDWGYSIPKTDPSAMVERVESDLALVRDVVKNAGIKVE